MLYVFLFRVFFFVFFFIYLNAILIWIYLIYILFYSIDLCVGSLGSKINGGEICLADSATTHTIL